MIQRVEAGRELSHGALADLGATLSEQIGRGVTAVHMNSSRVIEFDSQALESLIELNELCKSRGLVFRLVDPSDVLSIALAITGIESRFAVIREEHDKEKEKEQV
jgi:anti-anti-sigma regulatory factor